MTETSSDLHVPVPRPAIRRVLSEADFPLEATH
jgi:hypothetical protein